MRRRAAERESARLELIKVEQQVAADVIASHSARQAAALQIEEASPAVAEAVDSLKLNLINIREGAELAHATRPIEVLQPIQACSRRALTISSRSWPTTAISFGYSRHRRSMSCNARLLLM